MVLPPNKHHVLGTKGTFYCHISEIMKPTCQGNPLIYFNTASDSFNPSFIFRLKHIMLPHFYTPRSVTFEHFLLMKSKDIKTATNTYIYILPAAGALITTMRLDPPLITAIGNPYTQLHAYVYLSDIRYQSETEDHFA